MKAKALKAGKEVAFVPENCIDCYILGRVSTLMPHSINITTGKPEDINMIELSVETPSLVEYLANSKRK